MKRLLLFLPLALACAPPAFSQLVQLTCGQPGLASVSKTGTLFNFSGRKDDVMLVRIIANQANGINGVSVQDAEGILPPRTFGSLEFTYTVPADGNYRINVVGQGTGTYQVVYVPIRGSCAAVAPMQCGIPRKGTLNPGQFVAHQFTGKAGDNIFVRLVQLKESSDPSAVLTYNAYDGTLQRFTLPGGGDTFKLSGDGTFTLVVFEATFQAHAAYAISVVDLNASCGAVSAGCGTTVDSSIDDALQVKFFTIPAVNNDIFQFKVVPTDATGGLQTAVLAFDSQGRQLKPSSTEGSRLIYKMPDGTTSFLVLDAGGTNTGKFTVSFWQLNKPCNATPLGCGTPVSAQIGGPLRLGSYSLDAQAGDVYLLRLLHTTGTFTPRVEIYSPGTADGQPVVSLRTADLDSRTFTVPAAGRYNVIAYDDSDGKQSGGFTIAAVRLNRPCDGAVSLSCGVLSPGAISQALQQGSYSYNTAPGDAFSVRLVDTSGTLSSALQVYDPRGLSVAAAPGATKAVDVTNSPGGAYTVLVTDQSRTVQQGAFALQAFSTRGSCGSNPPQGQTTGGLISGPVPFNSYVFPASAGDAMLVRAAAFTAGFSANVDLYDPSGRRIGSGTSSIAPPVLTATGSYTAIVGASAARGAGSYAFSWQLLNNPVAAPLPCGQTVSASLGSANQFLYYAVDAGGSDLLKLLLTRLPGNLNAQMELYDPAGALQMRSTGDIVRKLTRAGTYLVVVSPASSAAESGGFALSLQRPNNPCSASGLTCGQTILQQATAAGQLDAFTFSANSGDQISVTVTPRQGAYAPVTELYDQASVNNLAVPGSPGGATLNANLNATSNYTLTVHDRTGNSGSYRVALQRTNNACAENDSEKPVISLRKPTGGDVVAGGAVFQIAWQSDDNISIASHAVRLSTDGGKTFTPISGAASLSGVAQSFNWVVPSDVAPSRSAMIQVTATDRAGNAQTATSDTLTLIGSGFAPNAQVTYQYDPLNRLTTATYQDGRVVVYTYDAAGNLATVTVQ